MLPFISFLLLGFLIGSITGLSSSSVAEITLSSLFTFIGGSIIIFIRKLNDKDRFVIYPLITAMSIGCLAGIYSSIAISEYQLLTPKYLRQTSYVAGITPMDRKVLRALQIGDKINAVKQKVRAGHQKKEDAYNELLLILKLLDIAKVDEIIENVRVGNKKKVDAFDEILAILEK